MTKSGSVYIRVAFAGLIATFVMTMIGFWQAGVGLPAIDVGAMLTASMNRAHEGTPYGFWAGNLAHFANGVLLAYIFVFLVRDHLPRGWLVQGLAYALLTTLVAGLVVVPLASPAGVFFVNAPNTVMMALASFIVHIAYALALTATLRIIEIESVEERDATDAGTRNRAETRVHRPLSPPAPTPA
ncbi:MAG: hypothetical protein SF187_02095 [Deltaproteobacteria bacterium]|nr:hypothetical protein [Deltaproteobacteria bacterium]